MSQPPLELREFSNGFEWVTSTAAVQGDAASERERLAITKLYDLKYQVEIRDTQIKRLRESNKTLTILILVLLSLTIGLVIALAIFR